MEKNQQEMHNLRLVKELHAKVVKNKFQKFIITYSRPLQFENMNISLTAKLRLKCRTFSDICWEKGELFNSYTKNLP